MRPNDPDHHICFDMTWFSFVFPNTALVTATLAIGRSLEARAVQVFGYVLLAFVTIVLLLKIWRLCDLNIQRK